jgi:hypothetical protein
MGTEALGSLSPSSSARAGRRAAAAGATGFAETTGVCLTGLFAVGPGAGAGVGTAFAFADDVEGDLAGAGLAGSALKRGDMGFAAGAADEGACCGGSSSRPSSTCRRSLLTRDFSNVLPEDCGRDASSDAEGRLDGRTGIGAGAGAATGARTTAGAGADTGARTGAGTGAGAATSGADAARAAASASAIATARAWAAAAAARWGGSLLTGLEFVDFDRATAVAAVGAAAGASRPRAVAAGAAAGVPPVVPVGVARPILAEPGALVVTAFEALSTGTDGG